MPCQIGLLTCLGGLVVISCSNTGLALNLELCHFPLGMENGSIPDQDLSASSSFDEKNVGPKSARIRSEILGGAWCPKLVIGEGVEEWIQVSFSQGDIRTITAVETQGRFGNGQGREFSPGYQIRYWRPGFKEWREYRDQHGKKIFPGNQNTYLSRVNFLSPPIAARKIRLFPMSPSPRTVC
ncbi:unnamed protein product, partial [Cyprideis torosa]